jgi:MerR family redox-sensitive transcriptional activator SoxR
VGKTFTISEIAARAGVEASALRFYERAGLLSSQRNSSGYRVYAPHVLRRLAFITIGQTVGMSLAEIREALVDLPDNHVPHKRDWERVSRRWHDRLGERIARLEAMRDRLTVCVGCGCLSLRDCTLSNRLDRAAGLGPGPRFLLGDAPDGQAPASRAD